MLHISQTKDWKRAEGGYETPEGLLIRDTELKDVCEYYKIPATLINIDKKFNTTTLLDVFKVAAPKVEILEEDSNLQILDPKSMYLADAEFDSLIQMAQEKTGLEFQIASKGFSKRATFKSKPKDSDSFVGDLFEKSFSIERLPQGGINLTTELLRLICTNGCVIPDSQYRSLIRSGIVEAPVISAFADAVDNFNVDEYFHNLFFKSGEALHASVADYMGMRSTLSQISDDDIANILFPTEGIEAFYELQGINLSKLSRTTLSRLPSGLKYYQCFNILTNGAKSAEKTLENELKVANWCRPSYLSQLKDSEVVFKGMPYFDDFKIKERMGDVTLVP